MKSHNLKCGVCGVLLCLGAALAARSRAATVIINPYKDNTLFKSSGGELSNGAGSSLYVGQISFQEFFARRPVMAFDIAANVPSDATITSASLQLHVSVSDGGGFPEHTLYTLTADWGEGTSVSSDGRGASATDNDATWIHRFFNTSQTWVNQGGDFSGTASAKQFIGGVGSYQFFSPQLAADVQNWLANPASNFGWILIGDEFQTGGSKQFDSRESLASLRPALTITYTPIPEPSTLGLLGIVGLVGLVRWRIRVFS
jgi:PEP-CTERM motif-containing protein